MRSFYLIAPTEGSGVVNHHLLPVDDDISLFCIISADWFPVPSTLFQAITFNLFFTLFHAEFYPTTVTLLSKKK